MTNAAAVRIVNLGEVSYKDSQAVYHAVANRMVESTPDTIILCSPREPYFCIGYHQNSLQALDQEAYGRLKFPAMRRRIGGGVTYLDNRQLFYQCVFHRSRSPAIPAENYRARLEVPIQTLRRIGVNAELRYTNEIEVAGRRIAGIGGGFIGEANVVVGNILNNFDYRVMGEIVNAPCEIFRKMAKRAMLERITTLTRENRSDVWEELPSILIDEFRRSLGRNTFYSEITSEEREEAMRQSEIMVSKNWLERRDDINPSRLNPPENLKISGSTSIRRVGVLDDVQFSFAILQIQDGIIEDYEITNSRVKPVDISSLSDITILKVSQLRIGYEINRDL